MSKTVTLRPEERIYEQLKEAAEAQRRPLSNLIEHAALLKIREEQFVDDAEMAEILGNERLMERLREGSRQGRERQGQFEAHGISRRNSLSYPPFQQTRLNDL